MITTDPEKRAQMQARVLQILEQRSSPGERDLLLSFARIDLEETPDAIALRLSPESLAARMEGHFRFVVHTMPPPVQAYRGLPGIHVSVRRPDEDEAASTGAGEGLPHEYTLVETHTRDVPFIFDSLKNYFAKAGLRIFGAVHPIFTVRRQWERVVSFGGPHDDGSREVYCNFQVEPVDSRERRRRMEHEIFSVLKCVFLAVEDFPDMLERTRGLAGRLRGHPGRPGDEESARAFLQWLADENYIFMGIAHYAAVPGGRLEQAGDNVSGVFSDPELLPVVFPGFMDNVGAHVSPAEGDRRIIDIDYCNNATAIYHLEPIDGIVIREWDAGGELNGCTLLLGRFARSALLQRADRIPILREKIRWIIESSGVPHNSHIYREMITTFNRLPMCELFYASAESLKAVIEPIVYMLREDEISVQRRSGGCYEAVSIAYSRLRYSYETERNLRQALAEAFGPISFHTSADCGAASVLLCYFDASQLTRPPDLETVRAIAGPLLATWESRVSSALEAAFGEREGRRFFERYVRRESRSGLYREVTAPAEVPDDVRHFEALTGRLEVRLSPGIPESCTLHLYSVRALGLTETLRTLANLGLSVTEELRILLTLPEGRRCYLYRLTVEAPVARLAALAAGRDRFIEALRALDEKRATDDPLNCLILDAEFSWREAELLRTLRNHLLQVRVHYNAETVNGVLLRNAAVASALLGHFRAKFDPAAGVGSEAAAGEAAREVRLALESVRSLAEDEILRALDNLVVAALRTNFYQRPERPVFAVKIDSGRVEAMPTPRPMFEIYVHSRALEGIHLRGGRVARGGIRWSDRHDDFRTEILGLMKTQMVKNSIIVPVGSKGGFVLKGELPPRPALDAYLADRYREFISGLLDLTDNLAEGQVIHPPEVVRHDDDDPYLVVAADKGTAHLSDTANSVSSQYGFWLGDAFASGGSVGYDHKKVGITARGVWECVKHHFRNLGIEVQSTPFTVCAVGDMAGDVFGNGMLQSRATKLVAAFNHAHIFIDPAPDPERSYLERERLFRLPRSTWRDYDVSLISPGGGVFDRTAKAIPVSPQMRGLFGFDAGSLSGEELIRRILTARVDLLYNGGIGTYVKSSREGDADVGDRANDRVRVDACDVQARAVAEGGNLGFTQEGRLQYWARGGQINTDAVDNSGGVDMSDHEVNIKILLDMLVKKGVIAGKDKRNRLLAEMTEDVAALVLTDNALQARALTLDGLRSMSNAGEFLDLIDAMVQAGVLSRADEHVPTREELVEGLAAGRGLPRPLLAVLLGHAKMWHYDSILQTDLPEAEAAQPFLHSYFPALLRERYASHFAEHRLRKEIAATGVVNHVINFGGVTLISRLARLSGMGLGAVVAAYLRAEQESGAAALRARVLAAAADPKEEYQILLGLDGILEAATLSVLEAKGAEGASRAVEELRSRLKL